MNSLSNMWLEVFTEQIQPVNFHVDRPCENGCWLYSVFQEVAVGCQMLILKVLLVLKINHLLLMNYK